MAGFSRLRGTLILRHGLQAALQIERAFMYIEGFGVSRERAYLCILEKGLGVLNLANILHDI